MVEAIGWIGLAMLVAGLALALRRVRWSAVPEWFLRPSHPVNLAVFRVVVFSALVVHILISRASRFSELPADLIFPPPGWDWILGWLPINPGVVSAGTAIAITACVFAAVGLWTRTSALLATIAALYVLGVPQFFGKINHYHHMIWFGAILGVSPSGDALSIDQLRRNRRSEDHWSRTPGPSSAYGLPLRLSWILLSLAYFFPGMWKVLLTGPEWWSGWNLRHHLWGRWFELAWVPAFRADQYPAMMRWSSRAVIAFELSVPLLILTRTTRRGLVALGLGFHTATWWLMRIKFWSLPLTYVALVDWRALWLRWRASTVAPGLAVSRSWTPSCVVGGTLIIAVAAHGLIGLDGWPIGTYPSFSHRREATAQVLQIEAYGNGEASIVELGQAGAFGIPPERLGAMVLRIVREREPERRLRALWGEIQPSHAASPDSVRFVALSASTVPGRWDERTGRAVLHTLYAR